MALAKAVALGAIAAISVPFIARDLTGRFGDLISGSTMHLAISNYHLFWNWPIFCLVTLAGWALLKAAES